MIRMTTVFIALICALPAAAVAEVNWRITARGGPTFTEDDGFDLMQAEPAAGLGEFMFEARLTGAWWASLSIAGVDMNGTAFQDLDADWNQRIYKATAVARWPLVGQLAWFGRAGPTLNRTALTLQHKNENRRLESISWDVGVLVGAGLDWTPLYRETPAGEIIVAFGFILEASYHRVVPADIQIGDAALGSLDPSGPSVTAGLTVAW